MVYSNKKQTKGVSQKVSNKKNNYKNRKVDSVSKKRNCKKKGVEHHILLEQELLL